jgi:hypothetical protein
MRAVRQIDRALKRLYNIETSLCAEEFLIFHFPTVPQKQIASKELQGALYVRRGAEEPGSNELSIDLGIYLSEQVREVLENFPDWSSPWSLEQIKAFSVACEEVSHFHYLVFNLERKRPISEFEIELQGEIDKFLLMYFCESLADNAGLTKFEILFEQLFINYRLAGCLNEIQKQRYLDASLYAKSFFQKMRKHLGSNGSVTEVLKRTRHFYQMDLASKISFLL